MLGVVSEKNQGSKKPPVFAGEPENILMSKLTI